MIASFRTFKKSSKPNIFNLKIYFFKIFNLVTDRPTTVVTRCRPKGTKLYWPAVECYHGAIIRLAAACRHRLACAVKAASSLIIDPWNVTDDDRR